MAIEEEIAELTQATNALLAAVNIRRAYLENIQATVAASAAEALALFPNVEALQAAVVSAEQSGESAAQSMDGALAARDVAVASSAAAEAALNGIAEALVGKEEAGAAEAAITQHETETNPHPQYVTELDIGDTVAGVVGSAVSAHESKENPHPQYAIALDVAEALSEKANAGDAGAAVTAHKVEENPHPQYSARVQIQASTRFNATGTADAMTGALAPVIEAYAAGLRVTCTPPGANTLTAPTLGLHALGGKIIFKRAAGGAAVALAAGDYNGSGPFDFEFVSGLDASAGGWILLNPLGASVSGSADAFFKPDYDSVAFVKTGAGSLAVKAGVGVTVGGQTKVFATQTAITMPALVAGTDYSIWVAPDGTPQAVKDTFAARATAPVSGARKIGGFHYGLVAPGTTVASGGFSTSGVTVDGGSFAWTQADVDKIAGINAYSLWDLGWRVDGEQYGMSYCPLKKMWAGIYFMSSAPHLYGISAYNTDVASGTVLPYIPPGWGGNGTLKYSALNVFAAHELLSSHGLRLPTYDEFMGFALGVTEGQSIGGADVTIPATARTAGFTSLIGIEQATGHHNVLGGPIGSCNGGAWSSAGRGFVFASGSLLTLGGSRGGLTYSGSRSAYIASALNTSTWYNGVRASGDHVKCGVPTR